MFVFAKQLLTISTDLYHCFQFRKAGYLRRLSSTRTTWFSMLYEKKKKKKSRIHLNEGRWNFISSYLDENRRVRYREVLHNSTWNITGVQQYSSTGNADVIIRACLGQVALHRYRCVEYAPCLNWTVLWLPCFAIVIPFNRLSLGRRLSQRFSPIGRFRATLQPTCREEHLEQSRD